MRLPVLAVGSGIYLPLTASIPVIFGGIAAYVIERALHKKYSHTQKNHSIEATRRQHGLTTACGIVAGASLMGVILAIPFTIAKSTDALKWVPTSLESVVGLLGILSVFGILGWLYWVVCQNKNN